MTDDVHRDGSQPAGGSMTPGATLAAWRERSGLSIEDVAAATRIRATVVRAIEHDDYELCGGEVYARGHLRAIAHAVGADADEVVAAFDRHYGGHLPTLTVAPISSHREPVREITRKATKSAPKWPAAAIAVLSLIVVLLAASWLVGRKSERNNPARAGGAVATSSAAPQSPTPEPTTAAPTTTAPTTSRAPSGVTVHVQVTADASWVRVVSSAGLELYQGILTQGQSKDFHDPTALALRFGNSNVVELTVNGTRIGRPCATQVCEQTFPTDRTQAG